MLVNGKSKTHIAKILKVNESTIYEYLKARNIESDIKEYIDLGFPR